MFIDTKDGGGEDDNTLEAMLLQPTLLSAKVSEAMSVLLAVMPAPPTHGALGGLVSELLSGMPV